MQNVSIHIPKVVQEVLDFYGSMLDVSNFQGSISEHLYALAERLLDGIRDGQHGALTEVNNYHPDLLGVPFVELKKLDLDLSIALQTIASQYGFRDWNTVMNQDPIYDPQFEEAIFLLLQGDLEGLKKRIAAQPELLITRSNYGHEATLLHYAASNGVEIWRQVVPENLPDIARFLIASGADKYATMAVYGGRHAPYFLAESSAHPYDAGIAEELLPVLR